MIHPALKHQQLRDILACSIEQGKYPLGAQLPSQAELASHYNLSQSTVREAVASLVQEGVLERIHGSGTYVKRNKLRQLTLAFILPTIFSSGFTEHTAGRDIAPRYLRAVESEARKHGAYLLIMLDHDDIETERFNIEAILERRVDGLIIDYFGDSKNLDCLQRLIDEGPPFVMIDNWVNGAAADFVTTDNEEASCRLTGELVARGCRRVVCLSSTSEALPSVGREQGYRRTMEQHGLTPEIQNLMRPEGQTILPQVAQDLVRQARTQTVGVLAKDADLLVAFWQQIESMRNVHPNFMLATFDEPYLSFPPEMQVLKALQPLEEIGRQGVRILMDKIKGKSRRRQLFLPAEIHLLHQGQDLVLP